jgi:hypothetical protein
MAETIHHHGNYKYLNQNTVKVEIHVGDSKETEFAKHIDECNNDFKENVMKKIVTLKLKDTSELNSKVTTINLKLSQTIS